MYTWLASHFFQKKISIKWHFWFYGFEKLSWFLNIHFNFIKLKISVKTISSYLPCSVLFFFLHDMCFVKFVFAKLYNLEIFHCIAIVKFCIDGALTHLFLKGSLWQV